MAFGQDFLKAFFGNDYLKDYRHAAKTFRTNGYGNSPRFKFLFHVYFNLNTNGIPALRNIFAAGQSNTIGVLVKTIDLPKFRIDTEVLNQYNRKRVIQKKVEYQPVTIKFHDDGDDLIRTLWYNYFSYYYKDPNQKYQGINETNGTLGVSSTISNGFDYNARDIYAGTRTVNDWGFVGESYSDGTSSASGKPIFFRDITIYGFNQHSYAVYTLINPMISDWSHDTYDYSQGDGVMEHTVTLQYETVKYYSGAIGAARPDTNATGFADPALYDTEPSALSRPGGTRSVLGQGGLIDTGIGAIGSLANGDVLGAVQSAGAAYQTFKGQNLKAILQQDVLDVASKTVTQPTGGPRNPNDWFPTPPFQPPTSTGGN